jgi:hypothetical protein
MNLFGVLNIILCIVMHCIQYVQLNLLDLYFILCVSIVLSNV